MQLFYLLYPRIPSHLLEKKCYLSDYASFHEPCLFPTWKAVIRYVFSLQIQVLSLWLAILGIGPTVISQEGLAGCLVSSVSVLTTEMVGAIVTFHGQVAAGPGGAFPILLMMVTSWALL